MKIIGITGGTGTGKSTVSSILKELGAVIIDCDLISRLIVKKGEKALNEIVNYFGEGVLEKDGELDRKKIAYLVFSNKQKLEMLNQITHKYISNKIYELIEINKNKEIIVIDAAIPIEKGFIDVANEIWVVVSSEEKRIQRIMKRDGISRDDALKRINSQLTEEIYKSISDKIIYNNSDENAIKEVVIKNLNE